MEEVGGDKSKFITTTILKRFWQKKTMKTAQKLFREVSVFLLGGGPLEIFQVLQIFSDPPTV